MRDNLAYAPVNIAALNIAASSVGYDGGVTGGIVVMEPFAQEFFPSTVGVPDTNFYCKYDDRVLQTFASIMHFTGALAAFPAGYFTAKYGRTR